MAVGLSPRVAPKVDGGSEDGASRIVVGGTVRRERQRAGTVGLVMGGRRLTGRSPRAHPEANMTGGLGGSTRARARGLDLAGGGDAATSRSPSWRRVKGGPSPRPARCGGSTKIACWPSSFKKNPAPSWRAPGGSRAPSWPVIERTRSRSPKTASRCRLAPDQVARLRGPSKRGQRCRRSVPRWTLEDNYLTAGRRRHGGADLTGR